MKSLDPRVNRLPQIGEVSRKAPLDQFGTFEVFVKPKDGKPFQHEGAVHAPNLEMAFVLAKETFTRRFTCVSLCVTDTRSVFVSPTTEGNTSVFDVLPAATEQVGELLNYEIYVLPKRGKQPLHLGTVAAVLPQEAMWKARELAAGKTVYNVWAIPTREFRFTDASEADLWNTLPEKKFRDAADYKGGDKLKEFLERSKKVTV